MFFQNNTHSLAEFWPTTFLCPLPYSSSNLLQVPWYPFLFYSAICLGLAHFFPELKQTTHFWRSSLCHPLQILNQTYFICLWNTNYIPINSVSPLLNIHYFCVMHLLLKGEFSSERMPVYVDNVFVSLTRV